MQITQQLTKYRLTTLLVSADDNNY